MMFVVRRIVLAASPMGFVVLALVFSALQLTSGRSDQTSRVPEWLLFLLVLVVIGFWMTQTYIAYLQRVYDPTWINKYDDEWMRSSKQRRAAARTLSLYRERLSEIDVLRAELEPVDDVLDLFETVGFYVEGNRLAPRSRIITYSTGYAAIGSPVARTSRLGSNESRHVGTILRLSISVPPLSRHGVSERE